MIPPVNFLSDNLSRSAVDYGFPNPTYTASVSISTRLAFLEAPRAFAPWKLFPGAVYDEQRRFSA